MDDFILIAASLVSQTHRRSWCDCGVVNDSDNVKNDSAARRAREALLVAAESIIDRGEIGQATVGSIARAAGMHRVTFYRHYPDKESLLVEVLARRAAPVLERAARDLESAEFFPEGLITVMAAAITQGRSTPGLIAALGLYPEADASVPVGTSVRFLELASGIVGAPLTEARDSGRVRRDVPIDEIVEWLTMECLALLLLRPQDSTEDTCNRLRRFVIPAISAPGVDLDCR